MNGETKTVDFWWGHTYRLRGIGGGVGYGEWVLIKPQLSFLILLCSLGRKGGRVWAKYAWPMVGITLSLIGYT